MTSLFTPSTERQIGSQAPSFKNITRSQITESSPPTDLLWRDDPYGTGLRSPQQVSLDWSDFTRHTFFNSAESKVNVAFDRIINQYPFDGSKKELFEYEDSLSGFEKYVFKKFPKFIGDIKFTKTSGQYITIQDKSGYLFPEISRNVLSERSVGSIASSGNFTLEFWLYLSSSVSNSEQVIFQKLNSTNNHGISVFLSSSSGASTTAPVIFGLSSGSIAVSGSFALQKGKYQHIAIAYDKNSKNAVKIYNNSELAGTSKTSEIANLDFLNSNIYIGSGSTQTLPGVSFIPTETFNGNIDELRFWKESRSQTLINTFYLDNVYQENNLAMYHRYNEPTGSFGSKAIVLDHSGNGLHGQITNFATSMRGSTLQKDLPMIYEQTNSSPVLFPDYDDLVLLNSDLLTSASRYDTNNPNLITKLIPSHYFQEAQAFNGMEKEFGDLSENYSFHSDGAFPGNGKIPTSQILSSFLFIWASFFDEIKIYVDAFSKLHNLSHSDLNSVPAQFLQKLGKQYGIELPNSFTYAQINPYSYGKDLSNHVPYSETSLRKLQEMLWRRFLSELPGINRMKGTIQSVRSTMLSLGINPDSNFRIKEFGGKKNKKLTTNFKPINSSFNHLDFTNGEPYFQSKDILAGYRHEVGSPFGAPEPSNILIDHLGAESTTIKVASPASPPALTAFTSASWAWEANYIVGTKTKTQSIFRIEHSSSLSPGTKPSICVNLMAKSGSFSTGEAPQLILAFSGSYQSKLDIIGQGIDLFDGSDWWVNVNHIARDPRSEFLVRAYKTNGADIIEKHYMSGTYLNSKDDGTTVFRNKLTAATNQGNRIAIGYSAPTNYTNDLLNITDHDVTDFFGKVGSMRFWSRAIPKESARTHALNPTSVGSISPLNNYFFYENQPIHHVSTNILDGKLPLGSWERLRLSTDLNQQVSGSDSSGNIWIADTSRNSSTNRKNDVNSLDAAGFVGANFPATKEIFVPHQKLFARLDPHFGSNINGNKVRIQSVQGLELSEELEADLKPVFSLDRDAEINDDRRFSIEASNVMALNEDIVNILSNHQYINDAIGAPEMMYSVNYPALEQLSDVYFNRLTDKINTVEYFKFFKWFDNNFGQLIERLLPRTTEFLGINFVIESHILERHKFEYKQADVHIDLKSRLGATVDSVIDGIIASEVT